MSNSRGITRREALKLGIASGAYALAGGLELFAAEAAAGARVQVWVIHGADKAKLMAKALETIQANGGFGHAVNKLALKVNAAWAKAPEIGATTHPELVGGFLKGCKEFGIKDVVVPEYPCSNAREAFPKSGILAAVQDSGFKMIAVDDRYKNFAEVSVKGKAMDSMFVVDDFLKADAYVNMPVCKNHTSGGLSISMKNWMGAVRARSSWHKDNMQQRIADSISVLRPTWTIVDATRVMLTQGPRGPSENLNIADMLIISKDQVAADAFCSMEFWKSKTKAVHIQLAADMGLGIADLSRIDVTRLEA